MVGFCELGCSPSAPTDGIGTVLFVSLESINLSILLHAVQRHGDKADGGEKFIIHPAPGLHAPQLPQDGGELVNGCRHETERIPAHRLEELHQFGTALLGECPENDCTIYRNVFRMAVDVDEQMGKLTGHARETMQREYERLLRELNHLYTMNHAVKKYREAQHDRT